MSEDKTASNEKLSFGIDLAPEQFYFDYGKIKFPIKKGSELPGTTDKIIDIVDEYEKAFNNPNATSKSQYLAHQKSTKAILELVLEGFNYDEMTKTIGYGVLSKAADLLKIFLVDNGGKEGSKLMLRMFTLGTRSG